MKLCPKCEQEKASENFYANHRHRDGLSSYCRECTRAATADRQRRNRRKVSDYQNAWRKANPEKYRAHKLKQQEREKQMRAARIG